MYNGDHNRCSAHLWAVVGPTCDADVTAFCKLERSGWKAGIITNPSLAASSGQQCSGMLPPCRPHASCSDVWPQGPHTSGPPYAGQHSPLGDGVRADLEIQLLGPQAHLPPGLEVQWGRELGTCTLRAHLFNQPVFIY